MSKHIGKVHLDSYKIWIHGHSMQPTLKEHLVNYQLKSIAINVIKYM